MEVVVPSNETGDKAWGVMLTLACLRNWLNSWVRAPVVGGNTCCC